MAKASTEPTSQPLDELSEQFLSCPLCLDPYTLPKVLACLHTFCQDCLETYYTTRHRPKTIPCPMCKELTTVPGNDVSNLKSNFLIVSLLHFVDSTEKAGAGSNLDTNVLGNEYQTAHSQDRCGGCGETVVMWNLCQVCHLWLCSICSKAHTRLPATSSHKLLSSRQVSEECKTLAEKGETTLHEIQAFNNDLLDRLLTRHRELPESMRSVKEKIETVSARAIGVIADKSNKLCRQVDQFYQEQTNKLTKQSEESLQTKAKLERVGKLLQAVKVSDDGFKNQKAMKKVEEYVNLSYRADLSQELGPSINMVFSEFNNNCTDLANLDMGQIRVVSSKSNNVCLNDNPISIFKCAFLVDREYISAVDVNSKGEKFVVANNEKVLVFRQDSSTLELFFSPLEDKKMTRPWGIAYCERKKLVYISQSGEHEGNNSVLAYTHRGKFHSKVASGLTLPRGVATNGLNLFVCDQMDKCVYIFTTDGTIERVLKKTPDGRFLFNAPMFVSVGKTGRVAVSDSFTSVKVFDDDYDLKFTYTSDLPESQFWDVHVMNCGTTVVCDWRYGLHKISPDFSDNGLITTETDILREPSALSGVERNCLKIGTLDGKIFTAVWNDR